MMQTKIPHYVKKAAIGLQGRFLCRQSGKTAEARKGGGYLYFVEPSGKKFPTVSGLFLVQNGLVEASEDGLLDHMSQSFRLTKEAQKLLEASHA
nr:hypothetical protein [uncultured Cohaesibacter sp.]